MSKTYTSRPGATASRGRGTQQNNRNTTARRTALQDGTIGLSAHGVGEKERSVERKGKTLVEERISHQGAYTVIAPDEQKRKKVTQAAQQEMAAYEAHMHQTTPKSFTYVGTAGGREMSMEESRRKLVQTTPNKTQKLLQQQARTSLIKQKEDAELQKKKHEQRQKAIMNSRRQTEEQLASKSKWDDQRKRTNEAFLRRLENKTRQTAAESSNQPFPIPQKELDGPELLETMPPTSPEDQTIQGASSSGGSILTPGQRKKVDTLLTMFPQYRDMELTELLESLDFSLDRAVQILQD